jgi:dUTP pyrophosphatase
MNRSKINPTIRVQRLEHAGDLQLPSYESRDAAGMDIRAALREPIILEPGARELIPTGFRMAIPAGYEIQVRPRSGLAWKQGLTMLNSPGTIDADYRGEIKLLAVNHGQNPITIRHGDRVAQIVLAPVIQARLEESESLDDTTRGESGFGSTGIG